MSPEAAPILLVEDDPVVRTFLADNLTADGHDLVVVDCVRDALRALDAQRHDLAVVDLGLPDGSGLELLRRIRAADGVVSHLDPGLPVVILSGRDGELDRVRGFERGADDYVTKPFAYGELRLRIAAVLRRAHARVSRGRVRVGSLEIDPAARSATVSGRRVELAAKE